MVSVSRCACFISIDVAVTWPHDHVPHTKNTHQNAHLKSASKHLFLSAHLKFKNLFSLSLARALKVGLSGVHVGDDAFHGGGGRSLSPWGDLRPLAQPPAEALRGVDEDRPTTASATPTSPRSDASRHRGEQQQHAHAGGGVSENTAHENGSGG